MTFFYACFGTRSRVLRTTTLTCFTVLLLCGAVMIGMAVAVPALKQKLPWQSTNAGSDKSPLTEPTGGPAEVMANSADPETVPSFTAIHLAHDGTARWTAAIAEFNGNGPKPDRFRHGALRGVAIDPGHFQAELAVGHCL
jgi:hypothetical protein